MSAQSTNSLILGPLLRYVDEASATIWVETGQPGRVSILGYETETFTICEHHFALVIIELPAEERAIEYDVRIDGQIVWPEPGATTPPSVIGRPRTAREVSVLVGSCRAAAPHEAPYTRELALEHEGRGIDTLWAHADRMISEQSDDRPNLLLLVGDQIYADDSSPGAQERIKATRPPDSDLPPEIVATFEEYTWLYKEAWSQPMERWMLSTVPSAMIFDDHDMIDDWNISKSWVDEIRSEEWWPQHVIEGLMSYWVYQHLGNLSPEVIRSEGMLDQLIEAGDGTELLRRWAEQSEEFTPVAGGYRFSFTREVGQVTVVVIDCRNARVLEGDRLMVGPDEWAWVRKQALAAEGDLLLATSVPVFIADGLHDFQVWSERICAGAWGKTASKLGERLRRGLDLEDWSAFSDSYAQFVELVEELRSSSSTRSVIVASGDIHFSYAARVPPPTDSKGQSEVWQIVSSPIRNALIPHERGVMRSTLTNFGAQLGRVLRKSVRAPTSRPNIDVAAGPFFANNMCQILYGADAVQLIVEQSTPSDDDEPELRAVAKVWLYGEKR